MAKWNKRTPPKYAVGTPLQIEWVDVVGSSMGNPKDAIPARTLTLGHFLCYKSINKRKCLLTVLNIYPDEANSEGMGYDVYPLEYIQGVKVMINDESEIPPPQGGDVSPQTPPIITP